MPTMTCDACGHDLPPDARFCPGCGTAVTEGVAAPVPVAEPDPSAEPAQPAEQTEQAEQALTDTDPPADPTTDPPADPADPADPAVADADPRPEPTAEPLQPQDERSKTTVVTVLGNLLAVAAGGTLGVLAGMAIRQVM